MIEQVYKVTYRERFGYANTLEEAEQMEAMFKSSFAGNSSQTTIKDNGEICYA